MMTVIDNKNIIESEENSSIILLHSYRKTEKRKKDGESRAEIMERRARRNKLAFLIGINIGIRAI